jgi:hypothetical protein
MQAAFLAQLQGARLKKTAAPKERSLRERLARAADAADAAAPRVPYDEARRRAGVSLHSVHSMTTAKIMLLQRNCVSPVELDNILAREREATGRAVDFVVLPEGAHHEGGAATLQENSLLRELAQVVSKHGVYAVLGTMSERTAAGTYHCTALVVGPTGELVATYRKRATLGVSQTPGKAPCCFDTPFGKVGVMICYDAENETVVREALEYDPVLMLNPVHISAGNIGAIDSLGGGDVTKARNARWRTSLESMARYMDHLVGKKCGGRVVWVRCDQPFPIGAGTSQVTSGARTQFVVTPGTTNWSVLVNLREPAAGGSAGEEEEGEEEEEEEKKKEKKEKKEKKKKSKEAQRWVVSPPPRDRTAEVDNCGNRYTMRGTEVAWTNTSGGGGGEAANARQLVFLHEQSNKPGDRTMPRGLVKIVDSISGEVCASVDLFRMLPIRGKAGKYEPLEAVAAAAATCRIGTTGFRLVSSPPDPSTWALTGGLMGTQSLYLVRSGTAAGEAAGAPVECHHVFIAPSTGILAVAYLEDPGVIVTLSARSSGIDARCRVLQQLDGVGDHDAAFSAKPPRRQQLERRVLTIWEFSQNRHQIPLHELLV